MSFFVFKYFKESKTILLYKHKLAIQVKLNQNFSRVISRQV